MAMSDPCEIRARELPIRITLRSLRDNLDMKSLLIFPPDWLPSEPYLSLPCTCGGFTSGRDMTFRNWMSTLRCMTCFSAPGFWSMSAQRIGSELKYLQEVSEEERET